jgi:phage-related tail protein
MCSPAPDRSTGSSSDVVVLLPAGAGEGAELGQKGGDQLAVVGAATSSGAPSASRGSANVLARVGQAGLTRAELHPVAVV